MNPVAIIAKVGMHDNNQSMPIRPILPVPTSTKARLEQLTQAGIVAWNGQNLATLVPIGRTFGPRTVADLLLEDRE
jgi:hypothetical protein